MIHKKLIRGFKRKNKTTKKQTTKFISKKNSHKKNLKTLSKVLAFSFLKSFFLINYCKTGSSNFYNVF